MRERPPILRWKVMLVLVAVVGAGSLLGSALNSTSRPPGIGWTGYPPVLRSQFHTVTFRDITKPINCATVRFSGHPKPNSFPAFLRRAIRQVCQKQR